MKPAQSSHSPNSSPTTDTESCTKRSARSKFGSKGPQSRRKMPFQSILPMHAQDTPRTDSNQNVCTDTLSDSIESSSSTAITFWPNEVIAAGAEFIGTFMFLFFAFGGTQVSHTMTSDAPAAGQSPDSSTLLYIALSFGFSLMVNVWVFFRVSGGLFNPAVGTSSLFTLYECEPICLCHLFVDRAKR